jgi:hypothetical protein
MKAGDKDEILLFFEQYFTDEEEMENVKQRKEMQETHNMRYKQRPSVHNAAIRSKNEKLKLDDLITFTTQRQVIGVVINSWHWEVENSVFNN